MKELPVKDHYIIYCEGRLPGTLFGVGKLIGEVPPGSQVLCLVSASSRHAWHWGLGGLLMLCPGCCPGNV